jgi:hypothetical protein
MTWVVKLGKPPVDKPKLAFLMIDHHVVGLHIPVHDPVAVAVVERLQQLEDVVPADNI